MADALRVEDANYPQNGPPLRVVTDGTQTQSTKERNVTSDVREFRFPRRTDTDRSDLLRRDPTRMVQVEERRRRRPINEPIRSQASTDESFRDTYAKQGLQPSRIDDRSTPRERQMQATQRAAQTTSVESQPQNVQRTITRRYIKKKAKTTIFARGRATASNAILFGWLFWFWLGFQVPFALLSTLGFGLMYTVNKLIAGLTVVTDEDNFIVQIGKYVLNMAQDILGAVAFEIGKLIGIDVSSINPIIFYIGPAIILICLNFFILLFMYLSYKLARLNPLSGEAVGYKWGTFALVVICYVLSAFLPVANLIPWAFAWAFVVWLYPK